MNRTYTQKILDDEAARQAPRRLAVIDSGIGGLSVAREIRRLLPNADMVYVADNGGFPYGGLADEAVVERCARIVAAMEELVAPSAVVVACNTASTIALAELRKRFTIPFIGCVPAIKWAAKETRSGTFGLLATPATVRREYLRELIAQFAQDRTVLTHGSRNLAGLAERRFRGLDVDPALLRAEVDVLLHAPGGEALDTIVLGCTHYTFVLDELRAVSPPHIRWLDPAGAVARRVRAFLSALPPTEPAPGALPANVALFTAPFADADTMREKLLPFGLPELRVMDLVGTLG